MSADQPKEPEPTTADSTDSSGPPIDHAREPGLPIDLNAPQFTLRAVLTGMVLAAVLSVCNVYIGLKLGVALNMSLVAVLLGYAFWAGVWGVGGGRVRPWGILENNISQTACSSGALVASAGLVAPIPALALMTGTVLTWHYLALWIFAVCLVGILVAIALRRQMVIESNLPFPVGKATAEMLRELHTRGREALARVIALGSGAVIAVGAALLINIYRIGPRVVPLSIWGFKSKTLTFGALPNPYLYGIGGLIGFRACASLLLGSILAYAVIAPPLIRSGHLWLTVGEPLPALPAGVKLDPQTQPNVRYNQRDHQLEWKGIMSTAQQDALWLMSDDPEYRQAVDRLYVRSQLDPGGAATVADPFSDRQLPRATPNYRDMLQWLVWPGVALMVVASLVSFAFSWRSILAAVPRWGRKRQDATPDRTGDVPVRWFVGGLIAALILSVVLQVSFFQIVWWAAVVGVLLAFVLAIVAARVSGETGMTPVGQMGKVAQLSLGALVPRSPAPNLMAANVAGGAASQAADLLHDLKCGHLLGTVPRLQALAQICGALVGALVGSAVYLLVIRDPQAQLMGPEWPAPGVATLKTVAELFQVGFQLIPPGTVYAMLIAAGVGVVLPVLEKTLPRKAGVFVPSAASIGLAFVIPAWQAIPIFLGGLAALCLSKWCQSWTKRFLIATCAGLIAGESLTDVGIALQEVIASRS